MTERDICAAASERTDPDSRAAFLDEACAGDAALRARVEQILQSDPDHTSAPTAFSGLAAQTPAVAEGMTRTLPPNVNDPDYAETKAPDEGESDVELQKLLSPPQEEGSLGRLDHYEVLGIVGRGGMGVVLRANDTKLRRVVALKLLAPALAAVGTARKRFAREAQSAAAVRDEHVVKIHSVYEDAAVPYIVMEFVKGITLEDRIRAEGPLPVRDVLRIGLQSAQGLAAAHAQGLVHRDVKPGNILLEDGVGRVKLTDFGLARAADDASISRSGVIAGTPMYMSPEQAKGDRIDNRSDLFSLGSVLYTLCTSRPAFRAESTVAVLGRVCDDEPRPIREVNPDMPRWVCAVVEKLMAKDPAERIQTAAEVANLFIKYLAHLEDPDRVPPPPAVRGVRVKGRWRLRRPAIALGLLTVVALGAFGYRALWPTDESTVTHTTGMNPLQDWRAPTAEELAAQPSPLDGRTREQIPTPLLAQAAASGVPAELVAILGSATLPLPDNGMGGYPSVSPDGKLLAVPNGPHVRLFDAKTGQLLRGFRSTTTHVYHAAFSPDSKRLAVTAGWLEEQAKLESASIVKVHDVETGKELLVLKGHTQRAVLAAFDAEGKRLATTSMDSTVRVWDASTGALLQTLTGHERGTHGVAFSPDGKLVAAGGQWKGDLSVRVWDLSEGKEIQRLSEREQQGVRVSFSPDGKFLAAGDYTSWALWDARTFQTIHEVKAPAEYLTFGTEGKTLWTGGADRLTSWDLGTARELTRLPLSGGQAGLCLTPDAKILFSHRHNPDEHFVRVHDPSAAMTETRGHAGPVWAVAVSPDGRTIASGGADGIVQLWDLAGWKAGDPQPSARALTGHTATVYSVAFSPDGKLLASGSQDGTIRLWDVARGGPVRTLQGETSKSGSDVAFTADGKMVASGDDDGSVRLWDVATGEERSPLRWHNQQANSVATSPDNRFLASAGLHDRKVYITDLQTMQRVQTLGPAGDQAGRADVRVAFGGDGRTLAYGGWDDTVHLWDVVEKKETVLTGGGTGLDGLAVDPIGRFVAATRGGLVRFWDRRTPDRPLVIAPGPFGTTARHVAFTPEGRYLVMAGFNGTVSILRTPSPPPPVSEPGPPRTLPETADLLKRPSPADALKQENLPLGMVAVLGDARFRLPKAGQNSWMAQDREGKLLAVPNADVVAILNPRTGELIRTLTGSDRMYAVAFSPDGRYLAGGSWAGQDKLRSSVIRCWDLQTGEVTASIASDAGWSWSLAYSPDGKRLIGACDKGLRVWEISTGKTVHSLAGGHVLQLGLSPDGKRAAYSDPDTKTVRVANPESGEQVGILEGPVDVSAFSPDGKILATGNGTDLFLWDAAKLELLKKIPTPASWLVFEPDGKTLLTAKHDQNADRDHVVTRWNLETFEGKPLPSLSKRAGWVQYQLSPDGKTLYANMAHAEGDAQGERNVRAYDAATGKELFPIQGHGGQVWSVASNPEGTRLASAGEDGTVRIWDLASGKHLHAIARPGVAHSVAISPNGKTLAAHWNNGSVVLFDPASGAEVRTLPGSFSANLGRQMSFSPDGALLAAAGIDGGVRVWDVASGEFRRAFWAGPGQGLSVAFSADGKVLLTGSDIGTVSLWDVASGWQIGSLPKQRGGVMRAVLHPDGRSVALAGLWKGDIIGPSSPKYAFTPTTGPNKGKAGQYASRTYEWDLEAGQHYRFILSSLDEGLAPLLVVDEAGDGKQLHAAHGTTPAGGSPRVELTIKPTKSARCKMICCAESGEGWIEPIVVRGEAPGNHLGVGYVPIYDLATCKLTHRLPGHGNVASSVAWHADGKLLVTTGDDGAIRLWNMGATPPLGRLHASLPFGGLNGVALTPEGRYAIVATVTGDIAVLRIPDVPPPYNPGTARPVPDPKEVAYRPSAAAALKRENISADLLRLVGGDDSARVPPEVVGILGDARFRLPKAGLNGWTAQDREGKFLAVANADSVAVFDARTGELFRTLQGTGRMYAVAFSPDGKSLAGGNWDGDFTVKVWDLETGNLTTTLKGHAGRVNSVAFTPDGTRLVSAADDAVRVWDLKTGGVVRTLEVTATRFWRIAISPDGKRIVCGDQPSRTVRVFDVDTGDLIATLPGHKKDVLVAAYSPDGKLLATGGDSELLIWRADKLELVQQIDTPAGWLAFEPDGKTLLAARHNQSGVGRNHVVTRWDLATFEGKPLPALSTRAGWTIFQLSPDGKTLYSYIARGPDDQAERRIRSYDTATGKEPPMEGHTGQVFSVAFSPDGKRIASVNAEPGVRLWDAATGKHERVLPNELGFYSVCFSPDGKWIAGGENEGTVVLYDAATGEKLRSLPGVKSQVWSVAFSPDGSLVAGTTLVGVVNVWEVATGRLRHTLSGRQFTPWSVTFNPDGKTLAAGGNEGEVLLFDVASGWGVAELRVGVREIRWLGFHPNGRSLGVVGNWGGVEGPALGVWDLATRKEIRRMPVSAAGHLGGAWRADGLLMASSGDTDGTVRLWSIDGKPDRHRIIQLYPPGTAWLPALSMSPEGRHLATANPDGTVFILRIPDLPDPYDPGPVRAVPDPKELAARPAAADKLSRENIPASLLQLAGRGDAARVPQVVVAILSDARFRLPKAGQNSWMAQDREGRFLAVPNADAVAVFDARTGELVRTLTGHTDRVYAVAFSPDGKFLAGGTWTGEKKPTTIKVWDLQTGEVTATLKGHDADICWAIAYSPDGTRLFSAAYDGLKVWDPKTGEAIRTLEARGDWFWQLGISPDGKRVVCGDVGSKTVRVFGTDKGEVLATLREHTADVRAAVYSPDGKWLATGNETELLIWSAEKLELVKKIDTAADWLAFDPDGKTLLAARHNQSGVGRNHVVTRWDLKTFEGKLLPPLSKLAGWALFQLSPDGKSLYSLIADGQDTERRVRTYDAATGKGLFTQQGQIGQVWSVAFSPDGKRLASVSLDPGIHVWNVETGKHERVLPHDKAFWSVAFSPDGKWIAGGENEGTVVLYDAATGEKLRSLPGVKSQVRSVAFSPDGSLVAGTTLVGVVNVWEVTTGRLRHVLRGRGSSDAWSWTVAFSPDGKTLATGWGAGEILLVDVVTGWEVADLKIGVGEVRWLGFHPDGRSLGAVGNNRSPNNSGTLLGKDITFGVFDLATRKEIRRMEVPRSEHGHVGGAWRADGLLMASCGANDGTVRLWGTDGKPDRDQVVRLFRPNVAFLHGMAMSPEGRHLATADPDGTVTILRLAKAGEVFEPATLDAYSDAEYVLSLGGSVRIDDQDKDIRSAADLPAGAFRLTGINLDTTQVTDAELLRLKDCKDLTALSLSRTSVGDAGLARFKDCKKLTILDIGRTKVTDVGAAYFKDCDDLTGLWLADTKVTDAGLVHFRNCKKLERLGLWSLPMTDAGLANFKDCKSLASLSISWTQVTDAGLAHFKDCQRLKNLWLADTQVTDAGLARFKGCQNLAALDLHGTQATDAGLAHFKDCKGLTVLFIEKTKIADLSPLKEFPLKELRCDFNPERDAEILRSMKTLKKINDKPVVEFWLDVELKPITALPADQQVAAVSAKLKDRNPDFDSKVEHKSEGGVVTELRINTDKVTDLGPIRVFNALRVLQLSGTSGQKENALLADLTLLRGMNYSQLVRLNLDWTRVDDAGLAHFKDAKALTHLHLPATRVTDAGLAHFKGCKSLISLGLYRTQVSDAGLANFKDCEGLTVLHLDSTRVTDAGLAHFKNCKGLTTLGLNDTETSDTGLTNFKDCKSLDGLHLNGTQVSDAGLANFKDCKNLKHISLERTQVGDTGLAHFKDCKNLTNLHLRAAKVTDAGLAHFANCKNLQYLALPEAQVGDAGLAHFKVCTNLKELDLGGTKVTNAGLAHFRSCKNLQKLWLHHTQAGDEGLANFKDCTNLTLINLGSSAVTDAGLAHLAGLSQLTELHLTRTKVSAKGIEDLAKTLPKCKIMWDGGTIEPSARSGGRGA